MIILFIIVYVYDYIEKLKLINSFKMQFVHLFESFYQLIALFYAIRTNDLFIQSRNSPR